MLALDAELREFEEAIPARYRLRLDPSGALIRPATHVTVTEMRAWYVDIDSIRKGDSRLPSLLLPV